MTTKSATKSLQILQKIFIRILGKVTYNENTEPLLKNYKILKVNEIYNLDCLKFIHFQLFTSHDYPIQIPSQFHNMNTRNRQQIRLQFPETETSLW